MTDEPYRWLEAIGNRREYVESQMKGASPVLGVSLQEGVLLLGVGSGHSKIFEIFDRHALAGLGHPADLERLRQSVIDEAHLEGFTRSPEDVSLRRLVSFGLAPRLKTAFEQIFSPPFLVRILLAEVGASPAEDLFAKVNYDGVFQLQPGGVAIASDAGLDHAATEAWVRRHAAPDVPAARAAAVLLEAWRHLALDCPLPDVPGAPEIPSGRVLEGALLERASRRPARFRALGAAQLGLTPPPP